ncbi:MAG: hypothetical protein ACTSYI_01860, partial [Promethearchaeota archaeon]
LFYQRREDFLVHQLDLLNLKELPEWFKARQVNLENPDIKKLLNNFQGVRHSMIKNKAYNGKNLSEQEKLDEK